MTVFHCKGESADADTEFRPGSTDSLREAMLEAVHQANAMKEDLKRFRAKRVGGHMLTVAEEVFESEEAFKRCITPTSQGSSQVVTMGELPVKVMVRMGVRRVFEVNTQAQTFNIQVKLTLTWKPPITEVVPGRVAWNWEPSWTPQFRFRRLMTEISSNVAYTVVSRDGIPYIQADWEQILCIYQTMKLKSFPVDLQTLQLDVVSVHAVEDVLWVSDKQPSPLVHSEKSTYLGLEEIVSLDIGILALGDFSLVKEAPYVHRLASLRVNERSVSLLTVEVNLARKAFYYILNVLLMVTGIISYVFCTWSRHPGDIDDRQDTDFDLILTAVTFKLVLTGLLPIVSYLTLMDIYVNLGCLFLCAVTVAHSAVPHTVAKTTDMSSLTLPPWQFADEDLLNHRDQILLTVAAAIWISFNVVFFLYLFSHQHLSYWRCVRQTLARQKQYRDEMASVEL